MQNPYNVSHYEQRVQIIKNILYNISLLDQEKKLIFKGGTSLMLFYGLKRFSEDLDFSMEKFDIKYIHFLRKGLQKKGFEVGTMRDIDMVAGFPIYYQIGGLKYNCQIDFGKKSYTNIEFNLINFSGNFIKVMSLRQSFAHKCCAFLERGIQKNKGRAKGRDVFDVNFYFSTLNQKNIAIDMEIIHKRLKISTFKELILEIYKALFFSKPANMKSYIEEIESFAGIENGKLFINNLLQKLNSFFPKTINNRIFEEIDGKQDIIIINQDFILKYDIQKKKYCLMKINELGKYIGAPFKDNKTIFEFLKKNINTFLG